MKKKVMVWMFAMVLAGTVAACGSDSADEDNSPAAETVETEETEDSSGAEVKSDDTENVAEAVSDEGDLGNYHVKIGDCSFGSDYEGKKMICVHYDFTNHSDGSATPLFVLDTKAFQDGVQLETAIAMDESSYEAGIAQKEIKSGVTLENCQAAYVLESDSPVEFEVSELISFSDEHLEKTFEVQ